MPPHRRESFWTRWPDEEAGPLWAGIHLHERGGVAVIVGVELFTEPPGDARVAPGPAAPDLTSDLLPAAPAALRGHQVHSLRLPELQGRLTASGGSALALPQGNARYGVDHWRRVAQVVQASRARHHSNYGSAREVARVWSISRSTAKKWVARAKQEGLL